MKILLAGEYSRLHNTLKEGLEKLGHEVKIVSEGDKFKNYPSDYSIRPAWNNKYPLLFFRKAIHKLSGFDTAVIEKKFRLKKILPILQNFDIVQLINPFPFETDLPFETEVLNYLFQNNGKAFLLACGDDYVSNKFYLEQKMRYSVLTPLLENPFLEKEFRYSLKYLSPPFKQLHDFVSDHILAVIPTDLDYAIPYEGHPKNAGLIPNPVNVDKIPYIFKKPDNQIIIFHGINSGNRWKKGNDFFSRALKLIKKKFGNKVHIIEKKDLPYTEYIHHIKKAHIVLDQVYSFDQGYNALESMAMGKVVFTGAEKELEAFYRISHPVCINALPDTEYLVEKLSGLIENPQKLIDISRNARSFIEKEHHYVKIAEKYLTTWERFSTG